MFKKAFVPALKAFVFFSVLCGIVFTLVVTGIAQIVFPYQANGSIITANDGTQYSELIGQSYTDPAHLWGRWNSYSTVELDNGETQVWGAGSNASPATEQYADTIAERVAYIQEANPDAKGAVPNDLVTQSGSGLDPEISAAAAEYQVPRVAQASGKSEDEVRSIIEKCTNHKFLGIFGEETVNVLKVNLMLDGKLS